MIVTVTMNPAIDKTVDIESFQYGGLNRITAVVQDPGGKGINVSKTIRELGGDSTATGFLAGKSGALIEQKLADLSIGTDFIYVEGETRTNEKVLDSSGNVTEFNEPGPVILQEDLDRLLDKLEGLADKDTLVVLAGSIPKGVKKDIYEVITNRVKAKGAKVFLDADGELFLRALEAKPDFIKPNRFELEQYFDFQGKASETDLIEMGQKLLDRGVGALAISLGSEGALFLSPGSTIKALGLKVTAHSTVGAGDAMVAAMAYGMNASLPLEECFKLGLATSAGAVTTVGTKPPSRELVDSLLEKVKLVRLS
ncbi:MAG: 1-phosphofructokinase [Lachnospiraceae bacterium]